MADNDTAESPYEAIRRQVREANDARRAMIEGLGKRLTTYASTEAQLVFGTGLALFVIDEEKRYPDPGEFGDYPDPTGDELLEVLSLVPNVRRTLGNDLRRLIAGARLRGKTWQEIGEVLGYRPSGARQGARAAYRRLGGKPDELEQALERRRQGGGTGGDQ